jgi:hypothetical protein
MGETGMEEIEEIKAFVVFHLIHLFNPHLPQSCATTTSME